MFVKKLGLDDRHAYRAVRLEALSLHENVYGGSFKDESAWDDAKWADMFGRDNYAFFGLFDQSEMVGIACVFSDRNDKTGRSALLAGGYVREAYRGKGYSHLLYEARINWIVGSGYFDRIAVGHRQGNEASRRANQAFGFEYKGQEEKTWGDGSTAVYMGYERKIA